MTSKVYSNGNTPEQQQAANRRYNARQRQLREWVDQFAETIGVDREEVIRVDPGDLASAYKHYMTK